MHGLRQFIHHTNAEYESQPNRKVIAQGITQTKLPGAHYPNTRAIFHALDAAIETPEPFIVPFLGAPGTGKTALLEYWAGAYRYYERGIAIDQQPVLVAEINDTDKASLGRSVYTTPTACVTFSSIMYALGELSRRVDSPTHIPPWYREERSLYTDKQFLWLFDQVCRESRRLRVRAIVIDNAQHVDVRTMQALLQVRRRLQGRIGLVLCAQLAKNETLDEPLGKVFEYARVDSAECDQAIELRPLTQRVFFEEVAVEILADLEADFEEKLVPHGEFLNETLWKLTAGDWKSITSRVQHFNRLLPPRGNGQRIITRAIVEQVLGRKLPT